MINEKELSLKKQRWILGILGIMIIGLQLKLIFTEINVDTEYAIAMSWRMMQGDFMFKEMWEPHQTSAFLLAFIMKIYLMITGTSEGIVLYINVVGSAIHCLVSWCIYQALIDKMEPFFVKLLCLFFITLHPKVFVAVTPEFTNMIVWFSVLLFLCMVKYYDDQSKKRWLVLASICLCLEILSYPSSIIVFAFILGVIFAFSNTKWKDICIITIGCAVQGSAYVLFMVINVGGKELVENISHILLGDNFHTAGGNIYGGLMSGMKQVVIWLGICLVVGYGIRVVGKLMGKRTLSTFSLFSAAVFITEIIMAVFFWYNGHDTSRFNIYLLVMVLYSCRGIRDLNETEKRMVIIAYVIALGSVIGVCCLTNLSFTYAAGYAIVAYVVSFLPIIKRWKKLEIKDYKYVYIFLVLTVCIGIFRGIIDIQEIGGIIRKGPASGIVTEYMDAKKNNCNVEDWDKFVEDGESILIVGENSINALGYILGTTTISIHSTMCGPTYNEVLLTYWDKYPERYPDVIAVQCWNLGNVSVSENSWIMQWILKEYQPSTYTDGEFYRFYRLKKE